MQRGLKASLKRTISDDRTSEAENTKRSLFCLSRVPDRELLSAKRRKTNDNEAERQITNIQASTRSDAPRSTPSDVFTATNKAKIAGEEAVVSQLTQDSNKKQKPIKFKDAVGRKFSFPFDLCNTWGGMEDLIRQAFLHVEVVGPHVNEGHYDLVGPNGDIILPQAWEAVIQPDWTVTMHMWPIPELAKDLEMPPPPPPPNRKRPPITISSVDSNRPRVQDHRKRKGQKIA